MKTLEELNEKTWYRFSKIVYIALFSLSYLFLVPLGLSKFGRDYHPPFYPDTIEVALNDPNFYKLSDYDKINALKAIDFEFSPWGLISTHQEQFIEHVKRIDIKTKEIKRKPSDEVLLALMDYYAWEAGGSIEEVGSIGKDKVLVAVPRKNPIPQEGAREKYVYSSYHTWNMGSCFLYLLILTVSYMLLMEIIRRTFYYVAIGKIFPNIKTDPPLAASPVTPHQIEHPSEKKIVSASPSLKEISFARLISIVMLLPVAIILLDIIFGVTFSKLLQELAETELRLIAYLLYFSLGIWLADYIYRLKKATAIIVISLPILFIYRFTIAAIFKPELLGQAMTNTLEEGLAVYITLSLFSFLFRHFEPKFDFAEIKNIFESTEPITKKKYDSGICSKCGSVTVIGRERFISFLGKSSKYFCGNCKRFIMGNPLNNIFLGITESVAFFLFMGGLASNMQGKSSSYSVVILILLVGIYDGIKRVFFGIKGVKISIIK